MGSELVLALVSALTFFGAGQLDSRGEAYDYSFLWALMSTLLSAHILIAFKGSWIALLLSQIGLFVGIGVFRFIRDPNVRHKRVCVRPNNSFKPKPLRGSAGIMRRRQLSDAVAVAPTATKHFWSLCAH